MDHKTHCIRVQVSGLLGNCIRTLCCATQLFSLGGTLKRGFVAHPIQVPYSNQTLRNDINVTISNIQD
jgi:hypothetical protein